MEGLIKCDIIIVVLIKICITKNNYVGKINNYRVNLKKIMPEFMNELLSNYFLIKLDTFKGILYN